MKLKELREQKKTSAKSVAESLNMPYTTYRNYETERNEPTIESLIKLADYYNVTVDYLIGREFSNDFGYMSDDEKGMVCGFRQLNKINQVKLLAQLEGLLLGQE